MNQYNRLLSTISHQYHILRGKQEPENEWKTRLVYSICGMMAYASLWDEPEEPVSKVHLRKKIRNMLANYKAMYPEISTSLPYASEELEEEITNQFLAAGVMYNCPNRIAPSIRREETLENIRFQRGIALDRISCVSGIGFYAMCKRPTNLKGIKSMFGLEQENLQDLWKTTVSVASWESLPLFENGIEYLRMEPPFKYGYWKQSPDTTGVASILRIDTKGSKLYYLYRYADARLEVSPIPRWRVESYNYRALACALLSNYGTLPPIEYSVDGELVHMRMKYLLPPRELAFLKLYSWPETCVSLPSDFRRKLSSAVFFAIKNILSDEGYEFKGGTI